MNNPINAPQSPNELVLRLIGGERDGQLFTVENEKCLLSDLSPGMVNAENYRCVIFRGEKGVAFRSYSDHVLCNGAKVSVQWLKKGDLIKLTDSFSVEVLQLGVYTKKQKSAASPTATRAPVNTVEIPSAVDPVTATRAPVNTVEIPSAVDSATATRAPVNTVEIPSKVDPAIATPPAAARPVTTTVPISSPAAATPPAVSGAVAPPTDYARPSVEFPSVSASSAGASPAFKPATNNFRTPTVTAPLPTHQVPTESPAPTASVSRMPVVTQAIDGLPLAPNSSPESEVGNQSLNAQSPETTPVAPFVGVPSAPSNSTIDSLSDRLSKLVSSAGEDGNSDVENSASTDTPSSVRPSVSTMLIEPAVVETVEDAPIATPEALAAQSPAQARPEELSVATPNTQPSVAAADDDSSSNAAAQASTADSEKPDNAADRRSALEDYFSRTGVSLSDATPPAEDEVAVTNAVSPDATVVEPVAPDTSAASAEAPAVPTDSAQQTMATQATPESPQFNLDSVLAKLEAESPDSPSPTQTVETSVVAAEVSETPVAQTPVAQTPVVGPPVVEPPVAATPVVEDNFEQPPVVTDNQDKSSSETAVGDQGGQLESFSLLQSLGLDTSGLGQIKKEISEAPLKEEVESLGLDAQQQGETEGSQAEAPEPEKVESVADVLARMQNAGSLQDFKAGEEEAESASVEIAQQETPTPPPTAPPVATPESSPVPAAEGSGAAEDDGSVEDYMSQLLNRMRGDSEPTSGEVAEQKQDAVVEKITAAQQVNATPTEPAKVEKLTQEEFVPKQKAVRMQSLDSLREIANSNAREAFRDSLAKERKVSTQTKLTLSMVSLGFAVLFFLMSYMKEQVNFWGVVFGIGFLIVGLLTARAYLSERKLDQSIMSD